MSEFSDTKNTGLKEQSLTIDTYGNPKAFNDFENISPGQNSLKIGNPPYFLKVSKLEK